MTALTSLWTSLHPYFKVALAAASGAIVIVGAPMVFADIAAIAMRQPVPSLPIPWRTAGLAAVVVGTAYWAHSPKGRDVWTDEQKAALKELKDGKL